MRQPKIKRVIVGIDGSSESMHAASIGFYVADCAKAALQLVNATNDHWVSARRAVTAAAASISSSSGPVLDAALVETARGNIAAALARHLPEGISQEIQVESGRAGPVLERVAQDTSADLIVIGGKHHSALGRWLAGSTAHYLARNAPCPILVTASNAQTFSRILVAIDRSDHAPEILQAGENLASTVHGALRVVHVVENAPRAESPGGHSPDDRLDESQGAIEKLIRHVAHEGTECTVARGKLWPAIQAEIQHWDADVLVIGSHGLGFENRQLLGRLSEECLHDLPTSTLIIPLDATLP